MRNPTVCKAYVDNVLSYLHGQGVSPQELQPILRFDIEEHITDLGRFPLRLFEMLLDAGSSLLGDRHLGARAGAACTPEPWSLVSYLGMSAPNIREAIDGAKNYSCLLIDLGNVELRELPRNSARLDWIIPMRRRPSQQVAEFFMASFYQACKPLLDRHDSARAIYFSYRHGGDPSTVSDIVGAPVHYGQTFTGLEFDSSILNCPTAFPHAATHRVLQQTAREELSRLPLEDRLISRVASIIERQLPDGLPPVSHIAEELQLSQRSLQRYINQSGTSFKDLAEETRKAHSLNLLVCEDVPLKSITAQLGFSCQSAFNRAFKRWFGLTPARYREQLQCS